MTQQLPPSFLNVVKSVVEAHPEKDLVDLLTEIFKALSESHGQELIRYLKEVPLADDEGPSSVLIQQLKLATEEILRQSVR